MEIKSCLDQSLIKVGRRVGNSTRLINNAIEILFTEKAVSIKDHYQNGEHQEANNQLFQRVFNRLRTLPTTQTLIVNKYDLTFKLGEYNKAAGVIIEAVKVHEISKKN